ncbi:MAG: hypothetical protein LRY44_02170 [Candidatus Pacebacteria bacterium]|nr:hypothetical protein [Candidatus Paceibacterota bacterium]MCD8563798.1 hypothetical protein [Candidatus Paceibacterota bacterium]
MKTSYIFKLLSSLDDNERSRVLSFWAAGTECEEHMITETPASLQENLLEDLSHILRMEIWWGAQEYFRHAPSIQ